MDQGFSLPDQYNHGPNIERLNHPEWSNNRLLTERRRNVSRTVRRILSMSGSLQPNRKMDLLSAMSAKGFSMVSS